VATNELELQRMSNLVERAKLNQIEVERLDAADLRQREPNIIGVGGLFVPETGIVDFKRVCEGMAGVVRKARATIELGVTVTAISESDSAVKISAGGREWQATKDCLCWIAIGPSGENGGPQDGSSDRAVSRRILPFAVVQERYCAASDLSDSGS
jgi:glycine/D-amino acid oxidase-like deaminating enzyme